MREAAAEAPKHQAEASRQKAEAGEIVTAHLPNNYADGLPLDAAVRTSNV